ncbi:Chromosomal replication initiator DnaA domain [Rhodopseudomonas palustris TIE-1]|uniref:helix-turn-helix domain-containing protein n=1 Tax=Rhodopseudomonas palustris TaxID=1076 RepID=UPI0001779778|nr:helix-turn-helix domain-containing protein [Rhodopseudomonas palustris]ACF01876.1 Chromosomal replication initiator DnaA domain [Rhodopseudomonas palustris TIE-1]
MTTSLDQACRLARTVRKTPPAAPAVRIAITGGDDAALPVEIVRCASAVVRITADFRRIERPLTVRGVTAIRAIQLACASYFDVAPIEMRSARRSVKVARARQVAMYLAKTMTPFSCPQIGRQFGGRDHTTVLHAVRRVTALMQQDAAFAADVGTISRWFAQGALA